MAQAPKKSAAKATKKAAPVKSEAPILATPKATKAAAEIVEVDTVEVNPEAVQADAEPVEVNPHALLLIDGEIMRWKSPTHIPGVGTVRGEVIKSDFITFQKLVKAKSPKTDSFDWISNEDLQAKAKSEGREKMKKRNGLS